MNVTDFLLRRYDDELRQLAEQALAQPQNRDAFEYGRMCGAYLGLTKARDILLQMQADENEKDI